MPDPWGCGRAGRAPRSPHTAQEVLGGALRFWNKQYGASRGEGFMQFTRQVGHGTVVATGHNLEEDHLNR
jgi:hypothetical protein